MKFFLKFVCTPSGDPGLMFNMHVQFSASRCKTSSSSRQLSFPAARFLYRETAVSESLGDCTVGGSGATWGCKHTKTNFPWTHLQCHTPGSNRGVKIYIAVLKYKPHSRSYTTTFGFVVDYKLLVIPCKGWRSWCRCWWCFTMEPNWPTWFTVVYSKNYKLTNSTTMNSS